MRRNRRDKKIEKNVIRCKKYNKPVFEHETCKSYTSKDNTKQSKNCLNCNHSF